MTLLRQKIRWSRPGVSAEALEFLPVVGGLAVLYLPTLFDLFSGPWSSSEQMHGPVILGISIWLIFRNWPDMEAQSLGRSTSRYGWPLFVLAMGLYSVGRSQEIGVFEAGSSILVLAGLMLLLRGTAALRVQWFALFFMLFMIPLPPAIVDTVTMPMKMAVSFAAENVLIWFGYPMGRSGVILQIGQYTLLVADACAGLHTLLTLEALGLLYLKLVQRNSSIRNIGLALLIIPISFTANVIRVMTLSLVTYHFGDDAGQGFLHGFAGMVLFMSALLLIIGFDIALQSFESNIKRPKRKFSDA